MKHSEVFKYALEHNLTIKAAERELAQHSFFDEALEKQSAPRKSQSKPNNNWGSPWMMQE